MQILMIGQIKPEWQVALKASVTLVEHLEGFAWFVDANEKRIAQYDFLIVPIDELLIEGELDAFALREYSGAAKLIVLNDAGFKMDFLKQQKNIQIFDQPAGYQNYWDDLGILAPIRETLTLASEDEKWKDDHSKPAVEDAPEVAVEKKARRKTPKPEPEKKDTVKEIEAEARAKKLPKLPKLALSGKSKSEDGDVGGVIINGRQEIGFIGALRGVGTTFAAFYYARQCAAEKRNVSLVLRDPVEAKVLADADKYVDVFEMTDLRSALKNDLVVYDFGTLDRSDGQLIKDFERCTKRYVVVCMSPFKKHGINNVLQYANDTDLDFTALFNFVTDEEARAIQKTFKGIFSCDNLDFINNI